MRRCAGDWRGAQPPRSLGAEERGLKLPVKAGGASSRTVSAAVLVLRQGKNHILASVLHRGAACPGCSRLIDGRARNNLLRETTPWWEAAHAAFSCIYGPLGSV